MTPNAQFVNIVVGFNKSKNKLQSIRKLKKNQQQKKTKKQKTKLNKTKKQKEYLYHPYKKTTDVRLFSLLWSVSLVKVPYEAFNIIDENAFSQNLRTFRVEFRSLWKV